MTLREMLIGGDIGGLGQRPSREDICSELNSTRAADLIEVLGDIEFHFDKDGELSLIHLEQFENSGGLFEWDVSIRRGMSKNELVQVLKENNIDFMESSRVGVPIVGTTLGFEFWFPDDGLNSLSKRFESRKQAMKQISVMITLTQFQELKMMAKERKISASKMAALLIEVSLDSQSE